MAVVSTIKAPDAVGDTLTFSRAGRNPISISNYGVAGPVLISGASVSGEIDTGGNLTGSPATFSGTGVTVVNEWEVSDSFGGPFTGTSDTDNTSPVLEAGKFYRFKSVGSNADSSLESLSSVFGPIRAGTISVLDGQAEPQSSSIFVGQALEDMSTFDYITNPASFQTSDPSDNIESAILWLNNLSPPVPANVSTSRGDGPSGPVELFLELRVTTEKGQVRVYPLNSVTPETITSPDITATVTPTVNRLYIGKTNLDTPNISTFDNVSNYSHSSGIAAVTRTSTVNDEEVDDTATYNLDDVVVHSWRVVANDQTVATFTADAVTVEFIRNVYINDDYRLAMEINPNAVTDNIDFDLTISGGTKYDGTYTGLLASDFEDTDGPFLIPGTHETSTNVSESNLTQGEILTTPTGLWTSQTGSLTLTPQGRFDGVDIASDTGETFVLTTDQSDGVYTHRVTADDGTNTPVVNTTSGLTVPAFVGGTVLGLNFLGGGFGSGSASNTLDATGTGLSSGDTLIVLCGGRYQNAQRHVTGIRLNGGSLVPPVDETVNDDADQSIIAGGYMLLTAPSDVSSMSFALEHSNTASQSAFFVYHVPNYVNLTSFYGINNSDGVAKVSTNMATNFGDVRLAMTINEDSEDGTWGNLTQRSSRGAGSFIAADELSTFNSPSLEVSHTADAPSKSLIVALNLSAS